MRVSFTFCQKMFKLFFRFRLVKLSGWGGAGGMITFLELAHMFDATQIGGFGMLTFFDSLNYANVHTCLMLRKLVALGC